MQEYRDDELVKSEMADLEDEFSRMESDSTHQVIGKFPKKKEETVINGLVFDVIYSEHARGLLHLQIKKPEK